MPGVEGIRRALRSLLDPITTRCKTWLRTSKILRSQR